MIYARVALAFVGALLVTFCFVKIVWEFVRWGVLTIAQQSPPFVGLDPRINYRVEAVLLAVGATLIFTAWALR